MKKRYSHSTSKETWYVCRHAQRQDTHDMMYTENIKQLIGFICDFRDVIIWSFQLNMCRRFTNSSCWKTSVFKSKTDSS